MYRQKCACGIIRRADRSWGVKGTIITASQEVSPLGFVTPGICCCCCVVVFTLNRSFYPTTSAVPPVSFLILHPREIQILWSQTVRQRKTKRQRIKVGKSSASVPGTRAQQKNATREKRATKKKY